MFSLEYQCVLQAFWPPLTYNEVFIHKWTGWFASRRTVYCLPRHTATYTVQGNTLLYRFSTTQHPGLLD